MVDQNKSLVLSFPKELGLNPVEFIILGDGKIGVVAPEVVNIVRIELLNRD